MAKNDELGSGKKQKPGLKETNEDHSDDGHLTQVAIVTPSKHKVERSKRQESETITTL